MTASLIPKTSRKPRGMKTTMSVTIQPVRGPRGTRFAVSVEGASMRTKFARTSTFGTESAALQPPQTEENR